MKEGRKEARPIGRLYEGWLVGGPSFPRDPPHNFYAHSFNVTTKLGAIQRFPHSAFPHEFVGFLHS